MLDDKDLQAISKLMDEKISASEQRMTEKIEASRTDIMSYIEMNVMPKFDLLAEGHQMLLDTLAPKPRVEALEDEVILLKNAIRAMSIDIAELKKAQ